MSYAREYRHACEALERGESAHAGILLYGLARAGYAPAFRKLGELEPNPVTRIALFRDAAERGDPYACYRLGYAYHSGDSGTQDHVEARKWLWRAAAAGESFAATLLGEMWERGLGGAQDHAEAARWYTDAALKGDEEAMCRLGNLYAAGRGVAQSLVTAYFWFNLSAARGCQEAEPRRDFFAQVLDPGALNKAQRLCATWQPVGH